MAQIDVLNMFNSLVVHDLDRKHGFHMGMTHHGVVLDFLPTGEQVAILKGEFSPLNVNTLFTREEREQDSVHYLLSKQILHYIEVNVLDMPGLFDLTMSSGTIVSLRYVKGITVSELEQMVQMLLYTNAPLKDAAQLKRIIEHYDLDYVLTNVQNNEMRVGLYRHATHTFQGGDDAVRYLCYLATGEALLIKSKEVIAAVEAINVLPKFFERHENQLAQVFNRHKRLILAAKNQLTAKVINRIARKSKTLHVPIRESVAKTFMHSALTDVGFDMASALRHTSVRDKMKYLNLLAKSRVQSPVASFKIRNGKVYTRDDRRVHSTPAIAKVEGYVLTALATELRFLQGKTILLDKSVNYGLPVSRKQTIGNLPFGTQVTVDSNEISSGMYWENKWGARDLDLSTIDEEGNRIGWGGIRGYADREIIFSGDLTDATDGAMEFMTSKSANYGIYVNIYSGKPGAQMELVVGSNINRKRWLENVLIREKHTLNSKNNVIGFVKGRTFTVYAGRLNDRIVSGKNPIQVEGETNLWTLPSLFHALGLSYDLDRQEDLVYDYDLTYSSFSYDKLEAVFAGA